MTQADVRIVLPKVRRDRLCKGLTEITAAVSVVDPGRLAHGALGGEFGYGAVWDDDVFMMRPYCWCGGSDCPWCGGCSCPPEATRHFLDGREVGGAEWDEFFRVEAYEKPSGGRIRSFGDWLGADVDGRLQRALDRAAEAANARHAVRREPTCPHCLGTAHADAGALPGRSAPNFWHKPSGFRVWWYKWIGRSMETDGACDWAAVQAECLASIAGVRADG